MFIFLTKSDSIKEANTVFYASDVIHRINENTLFIDGSNVFMDPSTYELVEVETLPPYFSINKFTYNVEKKEFEYLNEEDEKFDSWIPIRQQRDQLLTQSDFDSEILWPDRWNAKTDIERNIWLKYRQALRDLPEHFLDINSISWPTYSKYENEENILSLEPDYAKLNKEKAIKLLKETDWVELPSVIDTSKTLHLTNYANFEIYRDNLRLIAVHPSSNNDVEWPTIPEERWS